LLALSARPPLRLASSRAAPHRRALHSRVACRTQRPLQCHAPTWTLRSFSARRQVPGHSAHFAFGAWVHYPWHPAQGQEIVIHYREKRAGEEVFVCTVADEASVVIPAWMFDRAACARMQLGDRRVSIAALQQLRELLRELQCASHVAQSVTVSSEECADEETLMQGPPQAAVGPSDAVAAGISRAVRTRSAGRSSRPAQSPSTEGGRSSPRARGAR
jgi:hypothetical protein